ncbi:uncharacterized protein B0T23DRAFT_174644 [Neurospora hispaniola]|uniref:Uncharacterized protein n=1 Tax=Neurospora hispaniola TaxID=588809 RepID=A0AAJ0MQS3_9PEZI|nr:hypothetical protein B0T23DRAFT_174644 [Neurospora hispaniola]
MDVAYNQHSNAARRKNRSSTNLNYLSLAPLTPKLPIDNDDFLEQYHQQFEHVPHSTSYLAGKSAPTTPRLISHSPGPHPARAATMTGTGMNHSRGKSAPAARLPKSKSTTHLGSKSGAASPTHKRRSAAAVAAENERNLSDWLLRAGALISTETRESKGQSWLVSRASSTSLTGLHNAEEEAFERELARERELLLQNTAANAVSRNASRAASRNASRRGSMVINTGYNTNMIDDEYYTTASPIHSRLGSRSHSRTQLARTPNERHAFEHGAGYFHHHGVHNNNNNNNNHHHHEVGITEEDDEDNNGPGPDFVNLDEKLEMAHYNQEQLLLDSDAASSIIEDEIAVRRLVKDRNIGSWFGRVLGVQLFAVEEEDDEEDSSDSDRDDDDDGHLAYGSSRQHSEGQLTEDDGGSTTETDSSSEERRRPHEKQRKDQRRFEDAQLSKLVDERVPPPKEEGGTWHDAAWLLTVASKVIF